MSETITAIYEDGVLRPLRPLRLPEKTRVQLRIVTQTTESEDGRIIQALLSTGRVKHLPAALVTDAEVSTDRQPPPVLPGPSLSEIIIAQRQGEM
jgi:predicted DNA-binding antitoxin AbrB/MazE fold protein